MKFIIKYALISFSLLLLAACSSGGGANGLSIKGKVDKADNMNVYLDKTSYDNAFMRLGQSQASGNGSFTINLEEAPGPGLYRVRLGNKSVDLVLNGTEKSIDITGDISTLQTYAYTVDGSPLSTSYQQHMSKYIKRELSKDAVTSLVNSEDPLLASALATKIYNFSGTSVKDHKNVLARLESAYPDANYTKEYKGHIAKVEAKSKPKRGKYAVDIGEAAPEIALPGLDGKVRKLSDLKGQIVLLDFWASWCGPCRKANPHVVETYNKYKKDGFTVYSVSLDGLDSRTKSRLKTPEDIDRRMQMSKAKWEDAIKKDQLAWDSHVSDLKKWDSEASRLYGVRSIPTTFLIDREGKIAALNPRYNLEQEIQKLL